MEELIKDFKPVSSFIIYEDEHGAEAYIEQHKISNGQMLAGKPIDIKSLQRLNKYLSTMLNDKNIDFDYNEVLPRNVYRFNPFTNEVIWLCDSRYKELHFTKKLGVKGGLANIPQLLFKLSGDTLYVYAIKTKSIKEETILYKAPFHNYYNNGSMCLGNANSKKSLGSVQEIINHWEDKFFNSEFSHFNDNYVSKVNLNAMWNTLCGSNRKFDNSHLVRTKYKFKDIL